MKVQVLLFLLSSLQAVYLSSNEVCVKSLDSSNKKALVLAEAPLRHQLNGVISSITIQEPGYYALTYEGIQDELLALVDVTHSTPVAIRGSFLSGSEGSKITTLVAVVEGPRVFQLQLRSPRSRDAIGTGEIQIDKLGELQ